MSHSSALSEKSTLKRVQVAVPLAVPKPYDYLIPDGIDVRIGNYVRVPLGKREEIGVVWSLDADTSVPVEKCKPILEIIDLPPMTAQQQKFVTRAAKYTMADLGAVLKMCLSAPLVFTPSKGKQKLQKFPAADIKGDLPPLAFSDAQSSACQELRTAVNAQEFSVTLLDGVTGSGKTEVYFEAIADALRLKKQVLVLLPEIALSAQFKTRFTHRFGTEPALWHSEITPAQRRQIWLGVAKGESKVVIGARSALFLPFADLGLIVVDEEHDASYKQEDGVMYNARDMALLRAQTEHIPVVLVSATPSLESFSHATSGKYRHVILPERHAQAQMPYIQVIDLKKQPLARGKFISDALTTALTENLAAQEQSLLFLNRRGYAPLTLCRTCGHRFQCPSCSAWLVEHRQAKRLQCHHCGHGIKTPSACPSCHNPDTLAACGPGVERIEEEIKTQFPDARISVLASDTVATPQDIAAAIDEIERKKVDIIIGTQMVAKGHHFPDLTLVGIIDADIGMNGGDLRAAERTFQMLHQVSGRAGRAQKPGRVFLQTYLPDQPVMQAIAAGARDAFLKAESLERRKAAMPPFGRLAALILSSPHADRLDIFCRDLLRSAPRYNDIRVLGPAPAPIALLRNKHRRRFLIKAAAEIHIQKFLDEWLNPITIPSHVQLKIDIDPQSFF